MTRSLWKGPFVADSILKEVYKNQNNKQINFYKSNTQQF